jgi:DNA-directed RNA polymerase specialized sigma subunit
MASSSEERAGISDQLSRLVVMLRYHDELDWAEIAAVLDLEEQRVRDIHDAIIERYQQRRRAK